MARVSKRAAARQRASDKDDDQAPTRATRREEILAVAAATFARRGIANTTVRDIAERAGILSGSLYHHFTSKDEMLEEILRAALDPDIELDVELASSDVEPEQAVRELFARSLRFVRDHPDVAAIMDHSHHELEGVPRFEFIRTRERSIRRAWTAVLRRGVDAGVLRNDVDVDVVYKAMIGSVSTASRWYDPRGRYSVDRIAEDFTKIYLDGLRRSAGADQGADPGADLAG